MKFKTFVAQFAFMTLTMAGCSGGVGGSTDGNGQGGDGTGGENAGGDGGGSDLGIDPFAEKLGPTDPARDPLRRLTASEMANTLRDLFDLPSVSVKEAGSDQESWGSGFSRGASLTSGEDATALADLAERIATAGAKKFVAVTPCLANPGAAEVECAKTFFQTFGLQVFRRPLVTAEVDALLDLHRKQRDPAVGSSFAEATNTVVSAMLQSPNFLYRKELAPGAAIVKGDFVRLNSYEMASRLSYALWATMPDSDLFDLASRDELSTSDQLEKQVQRLLLSPRAKAVIADFYVQWLEVKQLPTQQKAPNANFGPESAEAMLQQLRLYVADVYEGKAAAPTLETLFSATTLPMNKTLAPLYGVANVADSQFVPTKVDASQRSGLLTLAAFLATHASEAESDPVRRGAEVLKRVLCQAPPPAPMDLQIPELTPPKEGQTTRQRFAQHSENPCAVCHKIMDPVGFAFENYDAFGAFRTMDHGKPVDASGSIEVGDKVLKFKNAIELSSQLWKTKEVQDCVTRQWFRFLLRRGEADSEEGTIAAAQVAFEKSGLNLKDLIVQITQSRSFSYRRAATGEVLR